MVTTPICKVSYFGTILIFDMSIISSIRFTPNEGLTVTFVDSLSTKELIKLHPTDTGQLSQLALDLYTKWNNKLEQFEEQGMA